MKRRGAASDGDVVTLESLVDVVSTGGMSSWALYTGMISPTRAGAWLLQCQTVSLSTATGAQCMCGKYAVDASVLQVKTLQMGEIRQIVASGYKLAHGAPLGSITWK